MKNLGRRPGWRLLILSLILSLGFMVYHFSKEATGRIPSGLASEYIHNSLGTHLNVNSSDLDAYQIGEEDYFSLASKSFYRYKLTESSKDYLLKKNPQLTEKDLDKRVQKEIKDENLENLVQSTSQDWKEYGGKDPLEISKPKEAVLYLKILYKDDKVAVIDDYVAQDEDIKDFQKFFLSELNPIMYGSNSWETVVLNPISKEEPSIFTSDESVDIGVDKVLDTAKITVSMTQDQYQRFLEKSNFELNGMDLVKHYLPFILLAWVFVLVLALKTFPSLEEKKGYLKFLDFFPWEFALFLWGLWIFFFAVLYTNSYDFLRGLKTYGSESQYILFFAGLFFGTYTYLLTGDYLALRSLQIKSKGLRSGLWEKTLVYKIIGALRTLFEESSFLLEQSVLEGERPEYRAKKRWGIFLFLGLLFFFFFILFGTNPVAPFSRLVFLLFLFFLVFVLGFFIHDLTEEMKRIIEGSNEIVKGNYAYQIPVEKTYFKGIANNFNRIASNLDGAVKEAVESAKVQSNLVTNVSHDLKTPLTSIINYADLLKDEEDPEKIKDYAQVIHEKSLRLKTLIDDLFEVSQTGKEIKEADLQVLNLKDLLNQVLGEWEDQFTSHDLKLITHLEEDLPVKIDGKRAYRIFDNLCSNISKYGLEGSRIYVDASKEGDGCQVVFKNISREALDKNMDFANRFTRGDEARSSEGHGLGLAIAKSLTLQMKGDFALEVDGDLFKVKVKFPRISGKDEGKMTETA